ncbi:nucleotidyltransferase family protein [Deferrisoma sp.]
MSRAPLPDRVVLVRGGSMAPCLLAGDRVFVRPPAEGEPRPGQVALLAGPVPVLHRVLRRSGGTLWVRGDAQAGPAEPVSAGRVLGVAQWRVRDGRLEDLPGPRRARLRLPGPAPKTAPAWVRWCLPADPPEPPPPEEVARWAPAARRERLAPLLAHRLAPAGPLPPGLEREALRAAAAEAFQTGQLARALEALGRAGVDVMPLKGVWLAHRVYPAAHLRPMNDADLLVPPGQRARAHEVLAALGLRPLGETVPDARPPGSPLPSTLYRDPEGAFAVHLHWDLVNATVPLAHAGRGPDPWRDAARAELLGSPVWEPPPEVHGALLLEHLTRPGHLLRPLVRLVDLAWFEARWGRGALDRAALLAQDTGWGGVTAAALPAVLRLLRDGCLPGRRDRVRVAGAHLRGHAGLRNKMNFVFRTLVPEQRFRSSSQGARGSAPLVALLRAARLVGALGPEVEP